MQLLNNLKVKIFADGADRNSMLAMNEHSLIQGLTTNPSLMRKAGVVDYRAFCKDILTHITSKPLSFEVFSDDIKDMERQAHEIASWGDNVYVKIPVMNTQKQPTYELINKLSSHGIKVNVTAIMTLAQVDEVVAVLNQDVASYISVFAGRIADTGRDPVPVMAAAVAMAARNPKAEVIWASPRELLNVLQADQIGCQIITVTPEIIVKLNMLGYDLNEYSLDTVKMFYQDAESAAFVL